MSQTQLRKPWLALMLTIPIPTISVLLLLEAVQGTLGGFVFAFFKIWLITIPLWWHLNFEGREWSWSLPQKGGWLVGAGLGVAMSAVILLAWLLIGRDNIDQQGMRDLLGASGLTEPVVYLTMMVYWIAANSVLEEIVFRWFIFERLECYVSSNIAIALAAAAFTLHHTVAMLYYFELHIVILGSVGVFIGGALWSWLYLRYRSIWIAYLSHAIVDVAVFGIGALILLG